MAILMIYFDQPTSRETRKWFSKLKVSAALSLGFIGSAMISWYTCFSQELYSHYIALIIIIIVMFIVTAAFAYLMFAADAWNNNRVELEDTIAEASMTDTYSLLCKVFVENKKLTFFITILLMCLVILSCSLTEVFEEVIYSFISKFVLGIVLPVTFSDLIDSSYENENELQNMVVI